MEWQTTQRQSNHLKFLCSVRYRVTRAAGEHQVGSEKGNINIIITSPVDPQTWSSLITEGGVLFWQRQLPLSLAATQSACCSTAAVQQQRQPRPTLLPLCQWSRCVCLFAAQQQEIRSQRRRHALAQRSSQTHIVGPHTPGVRSFQQKQKQQQRTDVIGTPVFLLFDLRRPGNVKQTPSQTRNLVD